MTDAQVSISDVVGIGVAMLTVLAPLGAALSTIGVRQRLKRRLELLGAVPADDVRFESLRRRLESEALALGDRISRGLFRTGLRSDGAAVVLAVPLGVGFGAGSYYVFRGLGLAESVAYMLVFLAGTVTFFGWRLVRYLWRARKQNAPTSLASKDDLTSERGVKEPTAQRAHSHS